MADNQNPYLGNPYSKYGGLTDNPYAKYGGGPAMPEAAPEPAPAPTLEQGGIGAYTGYPGMVQESVEQMGSGVSRIASAINPSDRPRVGPFPDEQATKLVTGAAETGLGAVGYATAPINAGLRAVVGRPAETVGVPKEYAEFGASLALPIPKHIPRIGKPTAPSAERLFEASDDAYKAARASPFRMQTQETTQLVDDIKASLRAEGYRDFTTPKTFRALGEFKLDAASDVSDIEAVRKVLNKARKDPAESDAARRAIEAIDERLSAQVPEIAAARADWAAGSRSERISEAVEKGARAPGASTRLGEKVINQLRALRNSPRARAGFSENELQMLDEIIAGRVTLDKIGTMLGGNVGPWAAITATFTGGLAPALGYGMKKITNAMTMRDVAKLDELVRSRSATGKAVGASFAQWSQAAQAFEAEPSIKAFVRASIASRNLANTARGADISLSQDSLMRALTGMQSGSTGQAEENQPQVPGPPQ